VEIDVPTNENLEDSHSRILVILPVKEEEVVAVEGPAFVAAATTVAYLVAVVILVVPRAIAPSA
jgi:hypothetical protein